MFHWTIQTAGLATRSVDVLAGWLDVGIDWKLRVRSVPFLSYKYVIILFTGTYAVMWPLSQVFQMSYPFLWMDFILLLDHFMVKILNSESDFFVREVRL